MVKQIKKAGVIGAGVMGATIAAHLANVGIETFLLDIVPPEFTEEDKKHQKRSYSHTPVRNTHWFNLSFEMLQRDSPWRRPNLHDVKYCV